MGPEAAAFVILEGRLLRSALALVQAVEKKCGCLQDDVAVIVIEPTGGAAL